MIGVDTLPVLPTDPGDRNRTSPFAFTGNRFEFRAPGSLQIDRRADGRRSTRSWPSRSTTSRPSSRSAVADGDRVQRGRAEGARRDHHRARRVVFNGDGYSEEWQIEAAERGLPNLRTTLDALPELITDGGDGAVRASTACSTTARCTAATRSRLEQYALSIGVEARLTLEIGDDRRSCRPRSATRPSWRPTSPR